mmetsp:Transcript_43742/g.101010  ORF Transcript_43742/g.101010 Transcript_43742/m.101010 type:complete len:731 (-) Transcript_43742:37-2229(-)
MDTGGRVGLDNIAAVYLGVANAEKAADEREKKRRGQNVQRTAAFEIEAHDHVDVQQRRLLLGMRVLWRGVHAGEIRFIGAVKNKDGVWVGLDLDEPVGRHNGTLDGVHYFACNANHGMLVRPRACLGMSDMPSAWQRTKSYLKARMEVLSLKAIATEAKDVKEFRSTDIKRVWTFTTWQREHKVLMWHSENVWQIMVDDSDPVQIMHARFMHFGVKTCTHEFKLAADQLQDYQIMGSLQMRWSQENMKWHYGLYVNGVMVPYSWTLKDGPLGMVTPEVLCRAAFKFRVRGELHEVRVGDYDGTVWALVLDGVLIGTCAHMSIEELLAGLAQNVAEGAGLVYVLPFDVMVKPYDIDIHCHVKIQWAHTTQTWQYLVYVSNVWVNPLWVCDQDLDFEPPMEVTDFTVSFKFLTHRPNREEKLNVIEVIDSKGVWSFLYNGEKFREVLNVFLHDSHTVQMTLPVVGWPADCLKELHSYVHCKESKGVWEFSLQVNNIHVPACWTWEDEDLIPFVTEAEVSSKSSSESSSPYSVEARPYSAKSTKSSPTLELEVLRPALTPSSSKPLVPSGEIAATPHEASPTYDGEFGMNEGLLLEETAEALAKLAQKKAEPQRTAADVAFQPSTPRQDTSTIPTQPRPKARAKRKVSAAASVDAKLAPDPLAEGKSDLHDKIEAPPPEIAKEQAREEEPKAEAAAEVVIEEAHKMEAFLNRAMKSHLRLNNERRPLKGRRCA